MRTTLSTIKGTNKPNEMNIEDPATFAFNNEVHNTVNSMRRSRKLIDRAVGHALRDESNEMRVNILREYLEESIARHSHQA